MLATTLGSSMALGQSSGRDSAVTSASGLTLARHGDPQRPSVALFVPEIKTSVAIIELPEHAWTKKVKSEEPSWFYKMYSEDPMLGGSVTWAKSEDALAYVMTTPSGFTLTTNARLEADGVAIAHEILGPAGSDLAAVQAPTCVKLYRPFTDVFLERTYVHHTDGLDLLASETPERLTKNAEEWLPCRYIANVGASGRVGIPRVEHLNGVTRYFKSHSADVAFIATESQPAGWTAATHGLNCTSVFTNPARTCQHADPEGQSSGGSSAVLKLKVYVIQGDASGAWNLVAKGKSDR